MPDWWATSDALRDVLVETGRLPPPRRTFKIEDIGSGWLVFDSERELVGRVEGLRDRYLVVRRRIWRFFLGSRLYVPAEALHEAHEGFVLLNVTCEELASMGWGRPPRRPPRRKKGSSPGPGAHLRLPHPWRHRA